MHIFTDADNTLWDTNAVFAHAQLALLREVEMKVGVEAPGLEDRGLAYLREVDQHIARAHPESLRYPPALLALALALALRGQPASEAAATALARMGDGAPGEAWADRAIERFVSRLRALPPLRPGVASGLPALAKLMGGPVTVVTEERSDRCAERLAAHGLATLVAEIVSAPKGRGLYADLRRSRPGAAAEAVMVGDQLDRDVEPARLEGYRAFLFPGGFNPFWGRSADETDTDLVANYAEVAERLSHAGRTHALQARRRASVA